MFAHTAHLYEKEIITAKLVLCAFLTNATAQSSCYATLEADTLRIGNTRIEQVFAWNDGALRTL